MREFKEGGYPEEKYPRVKGGSFGEWVKAIKGEGPEPGANFDFASPFTETMLLGTLVPAWYLPAVLGLSIGLCFAGAPLGDWAERRFGKKDPGPYVLDEVAGYLVPVVRHPQTLAGAAAGEGPGRVGYPSG